MQVYATDRKSVGAYSLFLGTVAVSWHSKKHQVTSISSAEAEYHALADASCEIIWFINLLRELHVELSDLVLLFRDNKATVDLTANRDYHARTKHIELDCHFIREKIQMGIVAVHQIPTLQNTANIFTKGLGKVLHWSCTSKLGLISSGPTLIYGRNKTLSVNRGLKIDVERIQQKKVQLGIIRSLYKRS